MEWEKVVMCCSCQSILLVEEDDIDYDYLSSSLDSYSFKCPVCGMRTSLDVKEVDKKVELLAFKKYLLKLKNNY